MSKLHSRFGRAVALGLLVLTVTTSLALAQQPAGTATPPKSPAGTSLDPQLPYFLQGKVNKSDYLQARQHQIDLLHGLPYNGQVIHARRLSRHSRSRSHSARWWLRP